MSSLFFIGGDRADPMPGKNERQGRSTNIFFFHEGSLQGHELSVSQQICLNYKPYQLAEGLRCTASGQAQGRQRSGCIGKAGREVTELEAAEPSTAPDQQSI